MKQVIGTLHSDSSGTITPLGYDPSCLPQAVCNRIPGTAPDIIFIIGFSGVGKTTQGGILARLLGRSFVDLDHAITKSAGKTIPQIFEEDGEDRFRAMESHLLHALATTQPNTVIACGGGTVCEQMNRRVLKESGISILLVADPLTVYERTRSSERPLLNCGNPLQKIRELMRERRSLYLECADLIFSTSHALPDELGKKMYERCQAWQRPADMLQPGCNQAALLTGNHRSAPHKTRTLVQTADDHCSDSSRE
jgi:shikimate kinase